MTTFDLFTNAMSPALLNEGAWFALKPWWERGAVCISTDDIEPAVRLRAWSSDKFQDVLDECRREHNPLGSLLQSNAQARAIFSHAMAKGLITGVRGLVRKGEQVGSDEGSLRAVLDDVRFPQFRDLCVAASQNATHYRDKVEERREGN